MRKSVVQQGTGEILSCIYETARITQIPAFETCSLNDLLPLINMMCHPIRKSYIGDMQALGLHMS